ncbi:hypothetical protein ACFOUP_18180 [Belliella kenyensis]|uniref:Uncharacterized protein n=1 Tax=Belliella kenyensis TaxID=1472724 RepID=A0ABV8ESL7_9BACT|nr:hypothetical protein [Belliella kenyensis]MCH7402289.1 hypothetical protein [Belliella kenyensis]MDN3601806.1 hypothetical protein [Belliella kenyensis]
MSKVYFDTKNNCFEQFLLKVKRRNKGMIVLPILIVLFGFGFIFIDSIYSKLGLTILAMTVLFISIQLLQLRINLRTFENTSIVDPKNIFSIQKVYLMKEKQFNSNVLYYLFFLLGLTLTISGYRGRFYFGDIIIFSLIFIIAYFQNIKIVKKLINPILNELNKELS